MFTGIIEKVAKVQSLEEKSQEICISVNTGFTDLTLGESVAVNGICLTVTSFNKDGLADFYVSPETLRCTNLGELKVESSVNLERALRLGDRLSGHWVQGHVDGVGSIQVLEKDSDAYRMDIALDESLLKYCIPKGSITVNGVSLTINQIHGNSISIQLIPHSWEHTNFSSLACGKTVNIEVDVLAKYTEKLCQQ